MYNNKARQNRFRENIFIREIVKFMSNKSEYIIEKIFEKLKKFKKREINLEKDEFKELISFLINKKK